MLKTSFDLLVGSAGLIVLSPLLPAIAVWIKLDSPGPVFCRGWRAGRFGPWIGGFDTRAGVRRRSSRRRCTNPVLPQRSSSTKWSTIWSGSGIHDPRHQLEPAIMR